MNERTLKDLIRKKFGETAIITHLDKKDDRLPLLNNGAESWRDYLLGTFRIRIDHIQHKGGNSTLLNETELFIKELEKLPNDAVLYIWKAESKHYKYIGWASDENIIYSRKYE